MKLDNLIAWVQAILSMVYLLFTFTVIMIYELGLAKLSTPGQEKTFDSMVSWMTGGALIVLYFWLQRARAAGIPDPDTTTVTQTTQSVTKPTLPIGDTHEPPAPPRNDVLPAAPGSLSNPEPRPETPDR